MTPEELKAALEEQAQIMKDLQAAAKKDREAHGVETAEFKAREARAMERMDELETKLNRPPAVPDPAPADPAEALRGEEAEKAVKSAAALDKYMRKGKDALSPEEMKLLTVGDSVEAGFLTSTDIETEITKKITEVSPIRQWARVRTTGRKSVTINNRTDLVVGFWTPETVTVTESNSKYGQDEVPVRKLSVLSRISQEDLDDSDFNMEAEMNGDVGEEFAQKEGAGFVNGDTTKKEPEGFLTNTAIPTITSAGAGAINADDLIDLKATPKSGYSEAPRAAFFMNRATRAIVRKLKDVDGQYLWTPSLIQGTPAMFDGSPVVEVPDMPNVNTGAKAVSFGDWSRGYVVVDRKGLTVLRNPFTEDAEDLVRFTYRKRVTGGVRLPEALASLVIQ